LKPHPERRSKPVISASQWCFQENSLVPTMTVAQNLFLGRSAFYNRLRGIYIAAQQFLQSLNFGRHARQRRSDFSAPPRSRCRNSPRRPARSQGHHLRRTPPPR